MPAGQHEFAYILMGTAAIDASDGRRLRRFLSGETFFTAKGDVYALGAAKPFQKAVLRVEGEILNLAASTGGALLLGCLRLEHFSMLLEQDRKGIKQFRRVAPRQDFGRTGVA